MLLPCGYTMFVHRKLSALFGKTNVPWTGSCLGAAVQTKRGSAGETQTHGPSGRPSCVHRLTPLGPRGHVQSGA